jgi:predicted nuclease of predicted toxin-antitoxin system
VSLRFLFDECLWPDLVHVAREAGHFESTCVRDRGLAGMKDHELIEFAVNGDFTLVTHNAVDFRGRLGGSAGGLYSRQPIHAGLVCLVSTEPMTPTRQQYLFRLALEALEQMPDLVNQALEVHEKADGEVSIQIYQIPL